MTAFVFHTERIEGTLQRNYIAGQTFGIKRAETLHVEWTGLFDFLFSGVKTIEMVLSHMVIQLIVMVIQIGLVQLVLLGIFQVPNRGSIILATCLSLVQGICGMSLGRSRLTNSLSIQGDFLKPPSMLV